MSWTNKKPQSKTPPWIYRQTSNRYHEDPIGQISQNYSNELEKNKKQIEELKNEPTK